MTEDPTRRLLGFFGEEGERALTPRERLGRYRLGQEIGRGGMAVVYEAEDPELGRTVAIKVLKDGPGERLRREAMAAARLRHPNVVTVHEVGADYIVMERVVGRTLAAALPSLSLRERVTVLETIARAVAHAHAQGVVHRDLKPENVLIESSGRVVLTDFGLAKTEDALDLTRSGAALGTPHYMAPEQVRGDLARVGPRSDVWALGVMLYELASDRRPFDGAGAPAVYDAILRGDPPALPGPLGAIAARALEKDPGRRYEGAGALADDLRRWLAGEPTSVQPATVLARAFRQIRRRPTPWLLGATVITVAVVVLALALWARTARTRVVTALREQARVSLQAALELRRAGASARMRQFVPPLQAAYEEAVARAPGNAELEYLMGRMHRALLDEKNALVFQDRALAKDPRYGPALYERALLLSLRYGRAWEIAAGAIEAAQDAGNLEARPDLFEARREAQAAWRAYFAAHGTGMPETPLSMLARGMAAHVSGRPAEARALLEGAVKREPMLEEAWEALGRAVVADQLDDAADQERRWEQQEALITARLSQDRGYVPHLLARGQLRWQRGARRRHRGRDPSPDYEAAAADFSEAIRLAPDNPAAWSWRGQVGTYRAIWRLETARDPAPDLTAATADLTRAITLDPTRSHAWLWRGNTRFYEGAMLAAIGRDARSVLEEGDRDLTRALRLSSQASGVLRWRGRLRAQLGAALARAGRDPGSTFAAADEDFAQAAARGPLDQWSLIWRSTVFHERARHHASLAAQGAADATRRAVQDLDAAERLLDEAIAQDRQLVEGWKHRGLVRLDRARTLEKSGERKGLRDRYAAASADLLSALTLNPTARFQIAADAEEARRKALRDEP